MRIPHSARGSAHSMGSYIYKTFVEQSNGDGDYGQNGESLQINLSDEVRRPLDIIAKRGAFTATSFGAAYEMISDATTHNYRANQTNIETKLRREPSG